MVVFTFELKLLLFSNKAVLVLHRRNIFSVCFVIGAVMSRVKQLKQNKIKFYIFANIHQH